MVPPLLAVLAVHLKIFNLYTILEQVANTGSPAEALVTLLVGADVSAAVLVHELDKCLHIGRSVRGDHMGLVQDPPGYKQGLEWWGCECSVAVLCFNKMLKIY